jgi:hypothetical protein
MTYCLMTIPAPWRDTPGPSWQLLAAMVRSQKRVQGKDAPLRPVQQRLGFA